MSTNNTTAVSKQEPTYSERFVAMVEKEMAANGGSALTLSKFQKQLIQNYFVKIDQVLRNADRKRLSKRGSENELPITWANVNMDELKFDVVAWSRLGLDPMLPNHINLIPYKNNASNKYDVTGIIGYRGCELKATKYGLNYPDNVIIEVVYSNDEFKVLKRDCKNETESYEFKIKNSFDRGSIIGGFYYYQYNDNPNKNKVRVFTLSDIKKRIPKNASVEFWGGQKDEWVDGKKTGQKVTIDGWFEEMCWKTIARAAFNNITLDSEKIDENISRVMMREDVAATSNVAAEIAENANTETIDFKEVVDEEPQPVQQEQPVVQNSEGQLEIPASDY